MRRRDKHINITRLAWTLAPAGWRFYGDAVEITTQPDEKQST